MKTIKLTKKWILAQFEPGSCGHTPGQIWLRFRAQTGSAVSGAAVKRAITKMPELVKTNQKQEGPFGLEFLYTKKRKFLKR